LLPIGNFHLGTRVHKFLRLNLNILKTTHAPQRPNYKRNCIMYGGINGTMGFLAPLSEDRFKMLGRLEMRLISVINHYAGLNPKAYRLSRPFNKMSHNHLRHVLDEELLRK
jgi:cleavage and polyadenylation specificity factor subunit 1